MNEPIVTNKDYLDSILNEQEQTFIRNFADNPKMVEAVRKALLAGLYEQGVLKKNNTSDTLINAALAPLLGGQKISNEEMGAYARALCEGLRWIESAFEGLQAYKTQEKRGEVKENQAR